MKYTGRITLVLISIAASSVEYLLDIDIDKSEVLIDIVLTVMAWFFGGLYDKVKFLSENDPLTLLSNRRYVDKIVSRLFKKASLNKEKLSLFLIDVNDFKLLNDTLGHMAGDKILTAIAEHLKKNSRKTDVVARWGGDEFLMITPYMNTEESARFTQRMIQTVYHGMEEDGQTKDIPIFLSIGCAIFPQEGESLDEMLSIADKRMYKMKRGNVN